MMKQLRLFALLLLVLCLAFTLVACGDGDTADKLLYEVNEDGETCTVTGLGDCTDTDLEIPADIDGYTVVAIGSVAFSRCTGLTGITIPDSVTSIGFRAFYGCTGLESITIPDSVTSISHYAFFGCTGLTSVTIGSGVTSIDSYAFWGCTSLASITIPSSVTSIGPSAFSGCTSLASVTFEDSSEWTHIGSSAFWGCYKLVEVYDLSERLTIKAGSEDNGCVGYYAKVVYTSVAEESRVHTTKDGYMFYEDGNEVYLVGYVGMDTVLTLPDKYNGKTYGINQFAFCNCTSLASITIPESVTSIGSYAFEGCKSLANVTFEGDSRLTSIGSSAFFSCKGLTSITIPDSVRSIGWSAFDWCTSLTYIYCRAASQPSGWDSDWKGYCNAQVVWGYTE